MTTTAGTGSGDEISDEARMIAAGIRRKAEQSPTAAEVAELARRAVSAEGSEHRAAVRGLAREAIRKAKEVNDLLGQLASLLDDGGGHAHQG